MTPSTHEHTVVAIYEPQVATFASLGIPDDSTVKYEVEVKAGKFLVLARGTPEMFAHAQVVLGTTGASTLAAHAA